MEINLANDFNRCPGGRYKKDHVKGNSSAEEFRDELLIPKLNEAITNNEQLVVNLDGVAGLAGSFLEEAFGGMIRKGMPVEQVKKHLVIVSNEVPDYVEEAIESMKLAGFRCQGIG